MAPRRDGAGRARNLLGCVGVAVGMCALSTAPAASTPKAAESVPPMVASAQGTISRTISYSIPPVRLVREDGKVVSLADELNDGRPVVLNFIYTTCSSICPLMSQVFAEFQRQLGAESDRVHLMSISVDPEEDTPARLRDYARKFHAGPGWQHYTGTLEASLTAQQAFSVWRGDKMSHAPVTFMRVAPDQPWLRIDGFATAEQLVAQYHRAL